MAAPCKLQGRLFFIFLFSFLFCIFDYIEDRQHLGNTQINLVFRSVCTIFASMNTLTLYELNSIVQELIETEMPDTYWVQGELSEGRVGYGGHFYGELVEKSEKTGAIAAKARVTCWQNIYARVAAKFARATGESLRPGMKVLVEVSVSFHELYGYSLTIQDIDPTDTMGDMARRRQEILQQLEKDGLLHANAELPMPLVPRRVAVVSSASAAGYGDFCNQLEQNEYGFSFKVKLFPAVMQGARVEESLIEALNQIAGEADQWDVVVIIRGGGATSDLSDFDSYPLAACIAQMPLPVITGIGHERDETVLDYVAHTHLKTPTAVASFLIQCMADALAQLDDLQQRMVRSVEMRIMHEEQRLMRLTTLLPTVFRTQYERHSNRLSQLLPRYAMAFRALGERNTHRLDSLAQRLSAASSSKHQRESHRLDLLEQRLTGLDPKSLLQRGYSMTLTTDGQLLRDATKVNPGQTIITHLANGEIKSTVQ